MFVVGNGDDLATLRTKHLSRFDLIIIESGVFCLGVVPLTGEREAVALPAGNLEVARDVVRCLRHGVIAIDLGDLSVGEAGAYSRIEDLHVAAECLVGLAHREWGTAHAFHATCHKEIALPGIDSPRSIGNGGQTAGAKPVHRDAADSYRKPRE